MTPHSTHRDTDRLVLTVMEHTHAVSRRHLAHLMSTSPMTAWRAANRLMRASILMESYGTNAADGRHGRFLTLNPAPPLLWLDLSHPHTTVTAILSDALLRPLCRVEQRHTDLYSDEDNLRLLWGKLRRHPAAQALATPDAHLGIALLPPVGDGEDVLPLLCETADDLYPAHCLTAVSAKQAVTESCLHAVPHDCERLLCLHTGERPRAATLRIRRDTDGTAHVQAEGEAILTHTLADYLHNDSDAAVAMFVQDYRRFHAPTPAVWVRHSDVHSKTHAPTNDLTVLAYDKALFLGSLLIARRTLWADMLSEPVPDHDLSQ